MNNHGIIRRIRALERVMLPATDADTRALAEQIAADEGWDPDELIEEARSLQAAVGPNATLKQTAAYIARRDGLTPDQHHALIDSAYRFMERHNAEINRTAS